MEIVYKYILLTITLSYLWDLFIEIPKRIIDLIKSAKEMKKAENDFLFNMKGDIMND